MNDTVLEQRQETLHARNEGAYAAQERRRLLARFEDKTDDELHELACSTPATPAALDACNALELRRSLREAFGPEATMEGHAKRLWEIYAEQRKLNSEEHTLRRILTERLQRTGEVVQAEGIPALRPVVVGYNADGAVVAARFDAKHIGRCRRCLRRGQELKGSICGNCGDDLRDDAAAREAGA